VRSPRRKYPLRAIVLVAVAALLAACGSADEAPGPAEEPDEPAIEEPEEPDEPEASAEFPSIIDGVLQPLESGFPSEPITLWQAFEPGSDDDVFNQFVSQIAQQFSPVPITVNTQQMGPAQTYELSAYLMDEPGSDQGYHVFATSFFGQGTRLFTQSALADIPADDLYARLNPINRMTFAPYSFLANLDSEFATIQEVEEALREAPGSLSISSSSPGGGIHASTLVWARQAGGLEFNYIPTDSPAEARQVLLGGGSDVATSRVEPGLDEQFSFLMVTGDSRLEAFPDVPAAAEFGYDIPGGTDRGYATVPGVPEEHILWLTELFRLVSQTPEFQAQYSDLNLTYLEPAQVMEARAAVVREFAPVLDDVGVMVREDYPTVD
jgi:tripartite-type tricarboxylate transporter receptor subunit TctC